MTANQRRPGFRLPWSSETDEAAAESSARAAERAAAPEAAPEKGTAMTPSSATDAATDPKMAAESAKADDAAEAVAAEAVAAEKPAAEAPSTAAPVEEPAPANDFMRDLVAAMRGVADEAREQSLADLKARADEQVRKLEEDAGRRADDLRARAEADVAGVGEWAKAEAERIKAEAEARVVARRAQLEQQLAGETSRTETDAKAVRERVAEYERELEAYHAQLAAITDPAAFAAAAKRMPAPPKLANGGNGSSTTPTVTTEPQVPVQPAAGASNGKPAQPAEVDPAEVHPAEEEVLAGRLAQLDASIPEEAAAAPASTSTEPTTTEVVVKGLGSFGAITGFRQALSGVDGVDGVALSLGQTGEFVFKATHATGFDLRAAITKLEGDNAKIDDRPEGGLRVTLEKAR